MIDPCGRLPNSARRHPARSGLPLVRSSKNAVCLRGIRSRFLPAIWPGNLPGELLLGFPACCRHVRCGRARPCVDSSIRRGVYSLRLLGPDEEFDGFGVRDGPARRDPALVGNIEFRKSVQQYFGLCRNCCLRSRRDLSPARGHHRIFWLLADLERPNWRPLGCLPADWRIDMPRYRPGCRRRSPVGCRTASDTTRDHRQIFAAIERTGRPASSSLTRSFSTLIRKVRLAMLGPLGAAGEPCGAALVPARAKASSPSRRPSHTVAAIARTPKTRTLAIHNRRPLGVAEGNSATVSASAVTTITDNGANQRGISRQAAGTASCAGSARRPPAPIDSAIAAAPKHSSPANKNASR